MFKMNQTDNMNDTLRSTLIVVLGMHRSGTSAITRAMETMGGNFGSNLMPAVPGVNDKGFFEDVDVNALNAEVMSAAGTDWHAMASTDLGTINPPQLDELRAKARTLLRDKLTVNTFVLKDPRIARLLPFWQPVFASLDVRVVYVIAVRNPISVAQSLAKRNEFFEEKSYLLWLAHMVPALSMTRDSVRAFLNYDRLMESPARELEVVATQLDLPLDIDRVAEFEKNFLDDQLRHTQYSEQDLRLVESAPSQVKNLYATLEAASWVGDSRHTPDLASTLDIAQALLDDMAPLLQHEWRNERHIQQLHEMLANSSTRIQELGSLLEQRNHRVWELDCELAERNQRVWQQDKEMAHHSQKLGELDAALAERNHRVWELDTELADRNHRVWILDKAIADCNRRREELDLALSGVQDLRRQIASLAAENSSQKEVILSMEQKISNQQVDLLNSAEAMASILRSTSWRLTAPLRALRKGVDSKKTS